MSENKIINKNNIFNIYENPIYKKYLDNLKDYCNKYDNIAILNQVRAYVGEDSLALSDVYADFSLISKSEYDRENGKNTGSSSSNGNNGFDVDELIKKIDRKIYEIEVQEEQGKKENTVKKVYLNIYVRGFTEYGIQCRYRNDSELSIWRYLKIKNKSECNFINEIKNHWVWVRGYEVQEGEKTFYLIEPHWFKVVRELSKTDKDFLKSDSIIEDIAVYSKAEPLKNGKYSDSEHNEDSLIAYQSVDDSKINGMVVLSEPGGGKTTYLKHLIYTLISIEDEADIQNSLGDFYEKNGLEKGAAYVPIFIRTRNIANILRGDEESYKEIINLIVTESIDGILNIKKEDDDRALQDALIEEIQGENGCRKLIVIDGFEELDERCAEKLLQCLDYAYDNSIFNTQNDRLIISSRYKEYGYQKLVDYSEINGIEEKYIVFDNKNSAIDACIEKWFDKLTKENGKDNYAYFNKIMATSDINRIITTPLELTGLIMIFYTQSTLPTDITILYHSLIEIWLTFVKEGTTLPFFSLRDMFLELSVIAYHMAESEGEKLRISKAKIKTVIEDRRKKLRRYYRSNAYVEASSDEEINCLIDFWFERNILVKNSNEDIYEFAHREYQSYLISYAIVNNFIPKDERKEKRIDYFKEHMDQAEDFWDRVIIFSAFMSTDIHDDIVDYILEQLKILKSENTAWDNVLVKDRIDNYYLSIILQLANAEGFYLSDEEYEEFYAELFADMGRINIMRKSAKGSEVKKLLSSGRKSSNTIFLNKCVEAIEQRNLRIEQYKEIEGKIRNKEKIDERDKAYLEELSSGMKNKMSEKNKITDIVLGLVFHVAWNCDVESDAIKKAFSLYLDNWITGEIIYEIKDSVESHNYNAERANLIREMGREALGRKEDSQSDYYMIISTIMMYLNGPGEEKTSPYKAALRYFDVAESSTDELEALELITIAVNIIFLTTWFLSDKMEKKCGCALIDDKGDWKPEKIEFMECAHRIVDYMKTLENNFVYKRDLMATYRDLCRLKYAGIESELSKMLYDDDIFNKCVLMCETERLTKESDENELSYPFEIIAEYPLEDRYIGLCRDKLQKRIIDIEKFAKVEFLGKVGAYDNRILILKLLVWAGKFEQNGRLDREGLLTEVLRIKEVGHYKKRSMLDEIEKYAKD